MSGAAPFGFKLEPTTIQGIRTKMMIPDPATANIARLMFEMYAEPSMSFGDIARYFAENNILIYPIEQVACWDSQRKHHYGLVTNSYWPFYCRFCNDKWRRTSL